MTRIILMTALLAILSEGTGAWILQKLLIEQKGFGAPLALRRCWPAFSC